MSGGVQTRGGKCRWHGLCSQLKKKKKNKGKKIGKLEKENLARTLLRCVDDILPAIKTESKCLSASVTLLNFLGLFRYRMSKKMALLHREAVIYFSFEISQLKKKKKKSSLRSSWKEAKEYKPSQVQLVMDYQLLRPSKTLAQSCTKTTWYRLLRVGESLKP